MGNDKEQKKDFVVSDSINRSDYDVEGKFIP